jgi:hypothetical protein
MTAAVRVAASEQKKRGRPRADYSTMFAAGTVLSTGEILTEDIERPTLDPVVVKMVRGRATRRNEQNQQLAFYAACVLLREWQPEWAWFWYAKPGELVGGFRHEDKASSPLRRDCRLAVLTELGRIAFLLGDDEGDDEIVEWAKRLCTLPMNARTKALAKTIRNSRLGREVDHETTADELATEISNVIDRLRPITTGEDLAIIAQAVDDVRARIDHVSDHVPLEQAFEQIRVVVEEPRVRVAEEEALEHEEEATQPAAAARGAT